MARLLRRLHRLHRALGSVLCVLMASWFLSGAVMTFSGFPYYLPRARLADLPPLGVIQEVALPPELTARVISFMQAPDSELSLVRLLGAPRLRFVRAGEIVEAFALDTGRSLPALSDDDARQIAARLGPVRALERIADSDQWTVPMPSRLFPLLRIALADAAQTELYLSAHSGEIVQRTTQKARLLAWLGAIPHWVYPTLLRRERGLWKSVVITLACFGLLLTAAGLIAGVDTAQRLERRRARRESIASSVLRDRTLRLHQRLGLGFGAFVLCWLFSGILSFNPFDWTQSRGLLVRAEQRLRGHPSHAAALPNLLAVAAHCQREIDVRELRVRYLAGVPLAICLAMDGARRVVVLDEARLHPAKSLPAALLARSAAALAGVNVRFSAQRVDRADHYYYPTHTEPDLVLPTLRIDAEDEARTRYYLDPHSGELLRMLGARQRLERFLYHGLHSWDLGFLYARRRLWHTLVLAAMAVGASLSLLGVVMTVRSFLRKRARARRLRRRLELAGTAFDETGQSVG